MFQKAESVNINILPPLIPSASQLEKINLASVTQKWPDNKISNVDKELQDTLVQLELPVAKHNDRVGIAVGSRGIDQLAAVVKQCIDFLRFKGYSPIIIPAMGSHGGASESGQRNVLASFGITEQLMGVPIRAGMETFQVGDLGPDFPVFFSKEAHQVDHLVVINRIKSHTKFVGTLESGLCKMISIGLGKGKGAGLYHQKAVNLGFFWIEAIAQMIINDYSILFGLALIENQQSQLAHIEAIPGESIIEREKKLLVKAKQLMPSIPFDSLDILMIDEIGKDISGIGMDANITGRHRDIVGDVFSHPHVKRIYVRGLSQKTGGNANGIGLADIVRSQCIESMDMAATYMNAFTALSPEKASIPVFFDTDQQCLAACLHTIGNISPHRLRLVWIKNTAYLTHFYVSEGLQHDIEQNPLVSQQMDWKPIGFDSCGNIVNS
ncbi:MAG: iron-sulfur cluster binding protein [Candidatus Magnetoglobus multicellularis str. Araruama]|uniref:Iron-sulfur cluster binding protein n=1 Tax=Candidatus Magnetoglobus multicellularis str. Araruama TaxID=890399 RepID=A0A1V1P7L2_9BACT|nr:MAG: iron-sulfur cluster binding protein [Candidatus Magnetoglobus multicellularis str. Araruama]